MTTLTIGFVLFPNVTQLDFTGPLQILHRLPGARTYFLAKTLDPQPSDCGLALNPNATFDDCPPLDMICVPGGLGVSAAMGDAAVIDFIKRAGTARYITSVCTGAFLLGAAGLLHGRRATTHWAYVDLLPLVGAVHEKARVVRDGNIFTGGGVTAGIDFALTIAAEIAGPEVAQALQLAVEYDPQPPFQSGHPDRAPDAIRRGIEKRLDQARAGIRQAVASGVTGGENASP